jgi:hypothetical protein
MPKVPSIRSPPPPISQIIAIRPASGYGSGSNRTGRTTLKIAAAAPMPTARVATATAVKPGSLRRRRTA